MNIALVDDNEADRLRLERTLRQYDGIHGLGLQIQSFPNGEALLRSYQPFQYTVIFLDIYMDGMSGIETARQIREKDADAILVFLTTSDSHRPDAFSLFASAYVDLCSMVGNIMENAVIACQTVEERSIQLTILVEDGAQLYIVAVNSFNGVVRQQDGRYLSTRHDRNGIGLESIASTAESYGGVAQFSHDEKQFFSNVAIPLR